VTDYAAPDFTIEQVPDDWEALASAGREVMQHMDTGRWLAGDLALRVEKHYGTDALGKYAADIGIASRETLKDYRKVAARYESGVRASFPALSWSHYRAAVRAGDDAELFLVQAQDNGWPVSELARQIAAAIGKPVPPEKLAEFTGLVAWYDEMRGAVTFYADAPLTGLAGRQRVTVKVYEAGAE
jgi:hypothetical protein